MWEKIIITVAASMIGAVLTFAVLNSVGALEKNLTETQISAVANQFVNSKNTNEVLLRKMSEHGGFRGERGERGEKGDQGSQGDIGPEWQPRATFYNLSASADAAKNQDQNLGRHAFCALARAGEPHQNQACICRVTQSGESWLLTLRVDESVNGGCYCGAACLR